jgi:hypothetical protein
MVYVLWERGDSMPTEIPTIKAEGPYKQKPADPGGIEIPHQDVRVYDELESKNTPQTPVEHLLPPPEIPEEAPHAALEPAPVPNSTLAPTVVKQADPAPLSSEGDALLSDTRPTKVLNTTVTPAPDPNVGPTPVSPSPKTEQVTTNTAPSTQAPKAQTMSIEQVIENTKSSASPAPKSLASGTAVVVQLASVPDQTQAQTMMKSLQQKYASQLGDAVLRLTRADLGSRGIYYRIQSQSMAEDEANQICSSLKQINAGCILVRK